MEEIGRTDASLGILIPTFLDQLHSAIGLWTFWVGVIKAPFFAAIIALVGCYEGFNVFAPGCHRF